MTDEAAAAPDSGKTHDPAEWRVKTRVAKFEGDLTAEQIDAGEAEPFEVIEEDGNLLLIGGVSLLWELAIGNRAIGAQDAGVGSEAASIAVTAASQELGRATEAAVVVDLDGEAEDERLVLGLLGVDL